MCNKHLLLIKKIKIKRSFIHNKEILLESINIFFNDSIKHYAYQNILKLGKDVVPLIMEDFIKNNVDWNIGLRYLTNHDIYNGKLILNTQTRKECWVKWWEENKHLYEYT